MFRIPVARLAAGLVAARLVLLTTPCWSEGYAGWPFGAPRMQAPVAAASTTAAPAQPCTQSASALEAGAGVVPATSAGTNVQPLTLNYAPRTDFRSSWVRVPVTFYRPVSVVDPQTQSTTTQLQPCRGYTWQLRRSPRTVARSLFSWLLPQTPAAVAAPAATAAPAGCAPAAPATTGNVVPGQAVPSTTAPSAAPYYVPDTGRPATGFQASPTPAAPSTPPSSREPADTRPSLRPNVPAPQSPSRPDSGTSPADAQSNRGGGYSQGTSSWEVDPVPDPEDHKASRRSDADIPPLLDRRNRTATLNAPTNRATAASVSGAARLLASPAGRAVGAAPDHSPVRWDDSGWQSERP